MNDSPIGSKVVLGCLILFIIFALSFAIFRDLFRNIDISLFWLNTRQNLGIISGIIGLWLGSASIIGEERLEKLDEKFKASTKSPWSSGADSLYDLIRDVAGIFTIIVAVVVFIYNIEISTPKLFFQSIGGAFVFSMGALMFFGLPMIYILPFIAYPIMLTFLFVFATPYKVMHFLGVREALKRTLVFIGLLLGSVSIFLLSSK